VSRARSPVRLALALSIAALLAVFLLYTSIAGGGTRVLEPSQLLRSHPTSKVTLTGKVVDHPSGDAHAQGLRFRVRDRSGTESVVVLYKGDVPDLFRSGREISVDGRLRNGVFRGVYPLVTKCPSKYAPKS
jgi:cytochrome c-type biogenesis protein CcmE